MTRRRSRLLAAMIAAAALVAPASVVTLAAAPASADGNGKHRHDLDTYKKEGWVAVGGTAPGNTAHEHLYCDPGDYAVDGMWKVDAHDGDDRGLRAAASYGDDVDVTEWHFRFTNLAAGRAQVKLFVTCLDSDTGERDGHTHVLGFDARTDQNAPVVGGSYDTSFATSCDADQMPVAPGFNFTSGTGAVYRSYPTSDFRSWYWAFVVDAPGGSLTLYQRCLDLTTSQADGHTHRIDKDFVPNYGGDHRHLDSGIGDESITARAHDEGIVGAFWIDDASHVAYLGQDARGQVRTTRFLWDGAGSDSVYLGILGIDKRTTKYPS